MRYCLEPGCPNKVRSGRCPAHARRLKRVYGRFKTGPTRYDTAPWIQKRDQFRVEHPICANPTQSRRCTVTTDVVDHIIPHRGNERLMFDDANLQPLCYHCHGLKTASETIHAGAKA